MSHFELEFAIEDAFLCAGPSLQIRAKPSMRTAARPTSNRPPPRTLVSLAALHLEWVPVVYYSYITE